MKKFLGKTLMGKVVSVHTGNNEDLSKDKRESLTAEVRGFAGDKHQAVVSFGGSVVGGRVQPAMHPHGAQIAAKYSTRSGKSLTDDAWLRPASGRRGVVGVVDVPGIVHVGDEVEIRVYDEPVIRLL